MKKNDEKLKVAESKIVDYLRSINPHQLNDISCRFCPRVEWRYLHKYCYTYWFYLFREELRKEFISYKPIRNIEEKHHDEYYEYVLDVLSCIWYKHYEDFIRDMETGIIPKEKRIIITSQEMFYKGLGFYFDIVYGVNNSNEIEEKSIVYKIQNMSKTFGMPMIDRSEETQVKISKEIKRQEKLLKKLLKSKKCLICENESQGTANSHSLPKQFLKTIENNGKVINGEGLLYQLFDKKERPQTKIQFGMAEAGTFGLICTPCETSNFKDYENQSNYIESKITQKMFNEIQLKNILNSIRQLNELSIQTRIKIIKLEEEMGIERCFKLIKNTETTQKLKSINDELIKLIEELNEIKYNDNSQYVLLFYKKLNHTLPFQIQSCFKIKYNDESQDNQPINVCVFNINEQAHIFLFIKENNKEHEDFFNELKHHRENEQLKIINLLIFSYLWFDIYFDETFFSNFSSFKVKWVKLLNSGFISLENNLDYYSYEQFNKRLNYQNKQTMENKFPNFFSFKQKY